MNFSVFFIVPLAKGGLDLGTLNASLVAIAVMGVLIVLSHIEHKKRLQKFQHQQPVLS